MAGSFVRWFVRIHPGEENARVSAAGLINRIPGNVKGKVPGLVRTLAS